jgi:hypothetical protein
MIRKRNTLPPKTRYDQAVPEGAPGDQWAWLLNEWKGRSDAFARELEHEQEELARAKKLREELPAAETQSQEKQTELLAVFEEIVMHNGGLHPMWLSSGEAATELLTTRSKIVEAIGGKEKPARRAARKARVEARLAEMKTQKLAMDEQFKAEAEAAWKACPDYEALSGSFPMFGFYVQEHCGGPQPNGWVTVSRI